MQTELAINTQKAIAADIFLHLRAPNSHDSLNFMFNHSYLFLISRLESKRSLSSFEQTLLDAMRKLPDLSKDKGMQLLMKLMSYSTQGYGGDESNLLIKMNAEICHELLGTLLRLPFFTLLQKASLNKVQQISF